MHIDTLSRLRDAVRSKRHEKWGTDIWFPFHDNAPAHRPVLVKDFLVKGNVTTLEHPPYLLHIHIQVSLPYLILSTELKFCLKK